MVEIRPVREVEAEDFLRLLCGVFDLDYGRARSIFFSEPLFDLSRKWALFEDGDMASILTTVPLHFGWGKAIGVAGVATRIDAQRRGLAAQLIAHVVEQSNLNGEPGVLLFAKDERLYRSVGFEVIDSVVRGQIDSVPEMTIPDTLDDVEVRRLYNAWSQAHPNRLRRDALRWRYWRWSMRVCSAVPEGYLCLEGGTLREAVMSAPLAEWSLPQGTEWFGLRSMREMLGVPLQSQSHELYLMARNIGGMPQMFMTDQF